MKKHEKDEIRQLPSKYRPIGAWGYIGLNILFCIPIIGQICLIIFACSGSNVNRRSYARNILIVLLIALIIFGIIAILAVTVFKEQLAPILDMVKEYLQMLQEGAAE